MLVENVVEETCVLRSLCFSSPRIDSFLHLNLTINDNNVRCDSSYKYGVYMIKNEPLRAEQ